MLEIDLFFDLRLTSGIVLLDPTRLLPPDPPAPWLDAVVVDGRTQRRRLEEARQILLQLEQGWLPSAGALDDAPILDDWAFVLDHTGQPALAGRVDGHPSLPGLRRIVTSTVIAIDLRQLGWARTVSRFYRLGRPRGTGLAG